MHTRSVLALAVATLASALSPPAYATVVQRATLEELATASAVIVHGTVMSVNETDALEPFKTVVEIEVTEPIKGLDSGTHAFRLELPGGRSGDYAMYIPGLPRFAPGDEVVLLLEKTPQGALIPSGLAQGVFRVLRQGETASVSRSLVGATYVNNEGQVAAPPAAPTTLDELLARLRALAQTGAQP